MLLEKSDIYGFYRTQVYLGSDLWIRVSLTHSLTHSLRDVLQTLQVMQVMQAMQVIKVMQVVPLGGQICN